MSSKKYFIILITLLLLASCGKQEQEEITTEVKKEVQNDIQQEITTTGSTKEDRPTPIPISTKTKDGISTKFVEPTNTEFDSSEKKEPTSLKVNKINKTYKTPGWNDEVAFTITMNGNTIEKVVTESVKWNDISRKLQQSFWDAINAQIKGKTLEEAKWIKAVGGASLTTKAFVDVLETM
jgi:hypothetical protein